MSNFFVKFSRLLTCLILLSLRVYSLDDDGRGKENRKSIPGTPPAAHKKKVDHVLKSPNKRKTPLNARNSAVDSQEPLPLPILAPVIIERDGDEQSEPDMFNPIGSRQAVQLNDLRLYKPSPDLFLNMGLTQENPEDEKDPSYHPSESSTNNSGSSREDDNSDDEYELDDDGSGHTERSSRNASSEKLNSDDEYESDKESPQRNFFEATQESSAEKFSRNALFNLQTPQEKKEHDPIPSQDFLTQCSFVRDVARPTSTQVDSSKSDVAGRRPSLRRLRAITPEPVQAKEGENDVVYSPEILASSSIVLDYEIPDEDFFDQFDGSPSQPSREDTESEEEEDLNGQFNDFSSIQHNTQTNVQGPVAQEDVVVVEADEEPKVPAVNSKPRPRMHGDFVPASALLAPQAQVTPRVQVDPLTEMMSTKNRKVAFAPTRPKSTDPHQHQVSWRQSTTGTGNFVLTLESGAFGTLMMPKAPEYVFKLAYLGVYPVLDSKTLEEAKREAEKLLPQLEAEKRQADLQANLYEAELAQRQEQERQKQVRLARAAAQKAKFRKDPPPK